MPDGTPHPQAAPPRVPLSRELIVAEAVVLIDEVGLDKLTMRSLGARLGVEAMALYRYVNGREDLLEGVVDSLVGQIRVDSRSDIAPIAGWQGFLQWFAHTVREVAIAHPSVFPLIATRHPAAPWLRPPLRSLRVVEEFLDGLIERGFTDRQAVHAYRVFTSFLLGHLLLEVATLGASTAPDDEPLNEGEADISPPSQDVEVSDYPTIMRTAPMLSEDHTQAEFEQSLEALLDRLDKQLSQ
jgi:AcrR family transcriptional regulator